MQILLDVSEYQSVAQLDHLLSHADDEIVGVYIKATQDVTYRDSLASAFAKVCMRHNTPHGYYDFLTNTYAVEQGDYFEQFIKTLPPAKLRRLADCEGTYRLYSAGVQAWEEGNGAAIYAQLSNMPHYASLKNPKIVAQYDSMAYYRPSQAEIDAYTQQGYAAWQFTSNYMGLNQDASVVLDLSVLRV